MSRNILTIQAALYQYNILNYASVYKLSNKCVECCNVLDVLVLFRLGPCGQLWRLPTASHCCNKYSKTCVKRPLSKDQKLFFSTKYHLMQVKSIAECGATFVKLPFATKNFVCLFLSGRFTQVSLYYVS